MRLISLAVSVFSLSAYSAHADGFLSQRSLLPAGAPRDSIHQCIESICGKLADFPIPAYDPTYIPPESPAFASAWAPLGSELRELVALNTEVSQRRGDFLSPLAGAAGPWGADASEKLRAELTFAVIASGLAPEFEKAVASMPSALDSPASIRAFAAAHAKDPSLRVATAQMASLAKSLLDSFPSDLAANELAKRALTAVSSATAETSALFLGQSIAPDRLALLHDVATMADPLKYVYQRQEPLLRAALQILLVEAAFRDQTRTALLRASNAIFGPLASVTRDEAFAMRVRNLKRARSIGDYDQKSLERGCRADLTMAFNADIGEADARKFENMVPKIMAAAQNVAKEFAPAQRAGDIAAAFAKEITVVPPLSFAQHAQALLQDKAAWLAWLAKQRDELEGAAPFEVLASQVWQGFPSLPDVMRKDCFSRRPTGLVDKFDGVEARQARISWLSVKYPQVGVPALAHELGHFVSWKLRDFALHSGGGLSGFENYSAARNCLNRRNPLYPQVKDGPFTNELQYTEEDWADHFSSSVMNQLRKSGALAESPIPLGCSLVRLESAESDWSAERPFLDGVGHSPHFLRMIFNQSDGEGATPQCAQAFQALWDRQFPPACN